MGAVWMHYDICEQWKCRRNTSLKSVTLRIGIDLRSENTIEYACVKEFVYKL